MNYTSYQPGTLTFNETTTTFDFSGTAFRLIPHGSNDPLSTSYSLRGGRWNASSSYEVMYTFTATTTAREFMSSQEAYGAFSWQEIQPEFQLDLLVLDWSVSGMADLATDGGLNAYGLPSSYPVGYESPASWSTTQPIGMTIHNTAAAGLVARSASATDFSGPTINWAELAVFPERTAPPRLEARIAFADWYFDG